MAQEPGHAELQHGPIYFALVDDGGVAQRAVRHRDRHAADDVVDDLVPDQDAQRIGAGDAVDDQADHRLGAGEPILAGDSQEFGGVDRPDAVLGDTAGEHVREVDREPGEIGVRPVRLKLEDVDGGEGRSGERKRRRSGQHGRAQAPSQPTRRTHVAMLARRREAANARARHTFVTRRSPRERYYACDQTL